MYLNLSRLVHPTPSFPRCPCFVLYLWVSLCLADKIIYIIFRFHIRVNIQDDSLQVHLCQWPGFVVMAE